MGHPVLILVGIYVVSKILECLGQVANTCAQLSRPYEPPPKPMRLPFGKTTMYILLGFTGFVIYCLIPLSLQIIIPVVGLGSWIYYRYFQKDKQLTTHGTTATAPTLAYHEMTIPPHLANLTVYVTKLQEQIAFAGAESPGTMPLQTINISAVVWKFRSVVSELAGALDHLGNVIADEHATTHDLERAFTCFEQPLATIVSAKRSLWEIRGDILLQTGRQLCWSLLNEPLRQLDTMCDELREILTDPEKAARRHGTATFQFNVTFMYDEEMSKLRKWAERAAKEYPIEASALYQ